MRARSGVSPQTDQLRAKVSDENRKDCNSPFEEIPITSSKKNRMDHRPTTGHHYISKDQANHNLALVNKPSA